MAGQPPPVPNSTFFVEELERALKECGFGILSWEVEPSDGQVGATVAQAEAKVELLPENNEAETGRSIRIKLSIQGYQVSLGSPLACKLFGTCGARSLTRETDRRDANAILRDSGRPSKLCESAVRAAADEAALR